MNKKVVMWVVIAVVILIGVVISIFSLNKNENSSNNANTIVNDTNTNSVEDNRNAEDEIYSKGKHRAEIKIKDYGIIELELDADVAPITVTNFAKLVNSGFYNGLTFHRIIDGFMIQGGDPLGNGTGGSSQKIKGEFSANKVNNPISHVRGTISMARSNSYNSASSQFFIVHEDSTFLDGQYAGFGKVTKGMEIVDEICKNTEVEDDNGSVLKENQPIIEEIRIVD